MSQDSLNITQYCSIQNGVVSLNGEPVFTDKNAQPTELFKNVYRYLEMKYPKFHKMDKLCKLAVLSCEQLLQNHSIEKYITEKVALVICNKHASLETDVQHQKSIADPQNYFPSPAVFVYTLANIMLGEIAIRHGFKGENACLVQETFNKKQFHEYCKMLFEKGETDCIIGGWVDFFENDYSTHLLCIEKGENLELSRPFDINTLNQLFTN